MDCVRCYEGRVKAGSRARPTGSSDASRAADPSRPSRPSRSESRGGPRLGIADWESAALDALAEDGIAGVAIEPIARRLGVTKGSFYWHFADRDALLRAAFALWEKSWTEAIIERLDKESDPRSRLALLVSMSMSGGRTDRIHLALASAKHPLARRSLARVTRRRLGYLESCYVELGQPARQAKRSALLAYAAYVGLVHLRAEAPDELPPREAYVDDLVAALVPKR